MDLLHNTVQPYAWGSTTAIPELLGVANPDGTPQAELWMGAHPAAPSRVERAGRELTLDALIAEDPEAELGPAVAKRFGGRLPFLLKVLAAQKALSIQLHPDRKQAEAGYAAEEERGVPRNARERVYVDDWPKPEVLCALTPFEVLAGLRPAAETADVLAGLHLPELSEPFAPDASDASARSNPGLNIRRVSTLIARLRERPEPATVKAVLAELLENPEWRVVVADVVEAATKASGAAGPYRGAYEAVRSMSKDHPGDIGLVCSLLMNHVLLEPGQTLFMAAGGVHAYIRGTGIELLANSDNVIRAGLTPKHIDVPELLRVLDPEVPVPVLEPRTEAPGVERYDAPVPEFLLRRLSAGPDDLAVPATGSPRILLCAEGRAVVRSGEVELELPPGRSCFLSAADPAAAVRGPALLFLAGPGE